jgi:protein TonB
MLAYAANRPIVGARKPAPNAMLVIIGVHVAAIAVLMSAKMELMPPPFDPPIIVDFIRPKTPPPPPPVDTRTPTQKPTPLAPIDMQVPIPSTNLAQRPVEPVGPTTINTGVLGGGGVGIIPEVTRPVHYPVKLGPRLATPDSELKPPYPQSKILSEEEAVLNLRLTIDQNGRVTAVEPVGRTDAAFLAAARRHLLAHWRYKPASEDGRPVTSTTVITLRFELDG